MADITEIETELLTEVQVISQQVADFVDEMETRFATIRTSIQQRFNEARDNEILTKLDGVTRSLTNISSRLTALEERINPTMVEVD